MKKSVLGWLAGKIRKRIPMLIFLSAVNVLLAGVGVAVAMQSKKMLDIATSGDAFDKNAFLTSCIVLAALVLVMVALRFLAAEFKQRLTILLDMDWKRELLHHLMNGEFAPVQQYHSGELVNRLSNDVKTVDDGIATVLPTLASMVTRLIGASIVLFQMEPVLTAVLLGAGLFLVLSTTVLRRALKNLHKKVAASDGKVGGFIQEAMEKLLIVEAMDVADEMDHRALGLLNERKQIQKKQKTVSVLGTTGMTLVMYVLYFGSIIVCAVQLVRGSITVGTLAAVTQLIGQLQTPFTSLSAMINAYVAMKGSAERLRELYELPLREGASADGNALYENMQTLSGEHLHFTYPGDEEETIRDLSFSVNKGQFVCITGESGAGKSTLLKLLLGIYPPDSGLLKAGDTALCAATRRLFTYVPQGNLLISGTLEENLRLTAPEATEEELWNALSAAGLDAFVRELPEGLNTKIKETGAGISEGQAQRLSIARALLKDAPVILLDEATSALDPETEAYVLDRMKAMAGKTVLVVTHRPYAKEIADAEIRIKAE